MESPEWMPDVYKRQHLALAAVQVEHPHFRVRRVGGADQHRAVSPNALVPIRQPDGQPLGIVDPLIQAVEINIRCV